MIGIHTSAYYTLISPRNDLSASLEIVDIILGRFAVPVFIFISGFVLTLRYKESISVKLFLKKRFMRVLVPYLLFSGLGVVLFAFWGQIWTFDSLWRSFAFFNVISYYYFIAIILELYLLFPFLLKLYGRISSRGLGWIFVVCLAGVQIGYYFFDSFVLNQVIVMGSWNWVLQQRVFLNWIFFFALGIAYAWNYPVIERFFTKRNIFLGIILIAGIYVLTFNLSILDFLDCQFLVIFSGICNMLLIIPLCFVLLGFFKGKKALSLFVIISELSFIIYLVHGYWQQGLVKLIPFQPTDSLFYPFLYFGILAGSLLTAYLYFKGARFLSIRFGNNEKKAA